MLAIVSVGAAWFQTARLFVAFGDPTALWWPYLAACSIEGGIIVAGLTLMNERKGYTAAIALLIFVANMGLSVLAQIGEAALSGGFALPGWLSLVVRFVAPPMVTLVGAALWGLKIARQWETEPEMASGAVVAALSGVARPSMAPMVAYNLNDTAPMPAVKAPKVRANGNGRKGG